jgi:hypothetical protein
MLPPAVRSWCDVPVAVSAGAISAQRLREVAAAWQAEGRSLWLLGSAPEAVAGPAPGVSPVFVASATSSRELETTINRPPQYFSVGTLTVYAAQVSP